MALCANPLEKSKYLALPKSLRAYTIFTVEEIPVRNELVKVEITICRSFDDSIFLQKVKDLFLNNTHIA